MNWTKTELFRLTFAERIAESKVRTQRNAHWKLSLSDWLSPNQKRYFTFWIKFGLSLKFGLSERLSEGLIQKVKSPNVARAEAYLCAKFHLDPSNLFGHSTQTLQTGEHRQTDRQTENGLIAQGKPFYKWSPKNLRKCKNKTSFHIYDRPLTGSVCIEFSDKILTRAVLMWWLLQQT